MPDRPIDFTIYPVRKCQSLHTCDVCSESITLGQVYYDGGYGCRAHVACVHPRIQGDAAEEQDANHLRRLIHELVKATCGQGYWHGYSAGEDVQHVLERVRYLESRLPSNRCASVGPEGQRCERPKGHGGQCGSNETGLSTWKERSNG